MDVFGRFYARRSLEVHLPYKSQAQERYFNANRGKLESEGVDVAEWNKASKGKKLPKRAPREGKRK